MLASLELEVDNYLVSTENAIDILPNLCKLKGLALLWQHLVDDELNGFTLGAVVLHYRRQLQILDGLEEVFIVHLELTFLQSLIGNPQVLIIILHLVGMRVQATIRSNDTIAVEVVVGSGIASVVATIGKDFLTRNRRLVAQTLVDEIPDETTLVFWILADDAPILLETTHGVAHSMRILALDERTGIVCLGIFLAVFIAHIHRTEDVGLAPMASLFVLNGTNLVDALNPIVAALEVRSIACLIAQAPNDDAGMIAQGEHIGLVALQVHLGKVLALGQCAFAITHAMTFEVSLSNEIKTC